MTRKEAKAIAKDIHTDTVDPEEKLLAIQEIADMETHNSVAKKDLVECIRWLIEDYL